MPALTRIAAALLALAACKDKKPADPPAPVPAAALAPADAAGVKKAAISPEARRAYREHLAAGRALAKKNQWRDAIAEFENALEVIPMDGRALSELGWASFQAGDYDRARDANKKSVLASSDPPVKAASLYNLGRVAEARGARTEAAAHYRESLKLRDNKTVRQRLAKLGEPASEDWRVDPSSIPCREPMTLDALCRCLEKARAGDYDEGAEFSCERDADDDDKFGIVRTGHGHGDLYVQVVGKGPRGWSVAAVVEYVYNPGAFGIFEELGQDLLVDTRRAGDVEVVWIEVMKFRTDRDIGLDEEESVETTKLTVCKRGGERGLECLFHGPIAESYERGTMDLDDDPDIEHTPGLPIKRAGKLAASLGADGTLTITLAEGQKTPWLAPYIGAHQLW